MFKAVTIDMVLVYLLQGAARNEAVVKLTKLLERGALDLRISEVLDLNDCATAHDVIAQGNRAGSVLLKT